MKILCGVIGGIVFPYSLFLYIIAGPQDIFGVIVWIAIGLSLIGIALSRRLVEAVGVHRPHKAGLAVFRLARIMCGPLAFAAGVCSFLLLYVIVQGLGAIANVSVLAFWVLGSDAVLAIALALIAIVCVRFAVTGRVGGRATSAANSAAS
jgi:hypothetical protein